MENQELFEIIYKSVCTGYDFGKFESAHGVTGTDLDKVARDILSNYVETSEVQPIGFMDNPSLSEAIEKKKSLEAEQSEEKEIPVELEESSIKEEFVTTPEQNALIEPETIDDYEPEFDTSTIEETMVAQEKNEAKGTTNGKKLTKEELYKQLESLMREFKDVQEETPVDDYDKAISNMLHVKDEPKKTETPVVKEETTHIKTVVDNNAMHVGIKAKAITPETPALTPFGTVAEKEEKAEPVTPIVYISDKLDVTPNQEQKTDYTQFFHRDEPVVKPQEPVKPEYNDTPFNFNGVVKNIIKSIKNDKNIAKYAEDYAVMPTDCLFLSTKQNTGKHVALILRLINKATGKQSYKYAIYSFQINPDGKGKVFNVTDKFEYKLPSLDEITETALNWNEKRQHLFENNMSEITNAYLKDAFIPEVRNEYMNWLRNCLENRPESMSKVYQYFIREF